MPHIFSLWISKLSCYQPKVDFRLLTHHQIKGKQTHFHNVEESHEIPAAPRINCDMTAQVHRNQLHSMRYHISHISHSSLDHSNAQASSSTMEQMANSEG